jgi:hypothetical protein
MTRITVLIAVAFVVSFLLAQGASAQLFGERTVGRGRPASGASTTRTTGRASPAKTAAGAKPAAGETTGSLISEDARFVRGNRTASDFVGAGTGEARRFVGSEQAGGESAEIRSAIDNLQVEAAPDANQTAGAVRPPRVPMNAPRLRIDFEFAPQVATTLSDQLSRRLQAASPRAGTSRIEVSVAGDVAILRGEVASARDRKLAELLVGFEPGIAAVKNQLVVRPADSPPPLPPPVRD